MEKKRIGITCDWLFFIICVCCTLYITLLTRNANLLPSARLIPLWSYYEWIAGRPDYGRSIILNIILFIPLGYITFDFIKNRKCRKPYIVSFLLCCAISIAIEVAQFITGLGLCDVDDIINNCLGAVIGICLFHIVNRYSKKGNRFFLIVFLFISAIGCLITSIKASEYSTQKYVLQFAFDISSLKICDDNNFQLDGKCYVYGRDTPNYQIVLKDEKTGNEYFAETLIDGDYFSAYVRINPEVEYGVNVLFSGYKIMEAFTYIYDYSVKYVPGDVPDPDVQNSYLTDVISDGVLKAYDAQSETYVYQIDNNIYWFVRKDIDPSTEIVYQVHTDEPELLPNDRVQYGFDNLGFRSTSKNEIDLVGEYRVYKAPIPQTYHVTAIMVGFSTEGKIVWSRYFRI